jgi:hypothetical protein
MPAKSKSPEAAQRKVWKAELKTLESNRRKVLRDFTAAHFAETKKVQEQVRIVQRAQKELDAAIAKRTRLMAKNEKSEKSALRTIDRRIAILRGRIGL